MGKIGFFGLIPGYFPLKIKTRPGKSGGGLIGWGHLLFTNPMDKAEKAAYQGNFKYSLNLPPPTSTRISQLLLEQRF